MTGALDCVADRAEALHQTECTLERLVRASSRFDGVAPERAPAIGAAPAGDCRVDFDGVKSYFNADSVAFAAREKAQALTGCVIGAIPPFSFNEQLQVLADPLVLQNEEVVFNAGRLIDPSL